MNGATVQDLEEPDWGCASRTSNASRVLYASHRRHSDIAAPGYDPVRDRTACLTDRPSNPRPVSCRCHATRFSSPLSPDLTAGLHSPLHRAGMRQSRSPETGGSEAHEAQIHFDPGRGLSSSEAVTIPRPSTHRAPARLPGAYRGPSGIARALGPDEGSLVMISGRSLHLD